MLRAIFMGLVLLPVSAVAQEFKDDTADVMSGKAKEAFSNALLAKTSDPFSTQVIRVRKASSGDESYCGLMNAKNLNGAYTGFTSFKFIAKTEKLYVDVACE